MHVSEKSLCVGWLKGKAGGKYLLRIIQMDVTQKVLLVSVWLVYSSREK